MTSEKERILVVEGDPEVEAFVSDTIARKSSKLDQSRMSETARRLGGRLLPLSMDGGRGLTRRCAGSLF